MGKTGWSLYTERQWQWVADRYREGYTARELADFLCVDYGTVCKHMRSMGVKREPWKKLPLKDRAKEFNSLRKG